MSNALANPTPLSHAARDAIATWDNEDGAAPRIVGPPAIVEPTSVELLHLRCRVIALENLVIALLAEASDHQLQLVREMAAFISPRPGYTPHPLTLHAATQMTNLVERAGQFRQ